MKIVSETLFMGRPHRFTFIETDDFSQFSPITQAWSLSYVGDKLLVGKSPSGSFNLPGGTVEMGENPIDTLHRELDEEVSATIDAFCLLGVQKVEELDTGKTYYQLRFACKVTLHDLKPDPCFGECWERILIDPADFLKYFSWGPIGSHLATKSAMIVKKI